MKILVIIASVRIQFQEKEKTQHQKINELG